MLQGFGRIWGRSAREGGHAGEIQEGRRDWAGGQSRSGFCKQGSDYGLSGIDGDILAWLWPTYHRLPHTPSLNVAEDGVVPCVIPRSRYHCNIAGLLVIITDLWGEIILYSLNYSCYKYLNHDARKATSTSWDGIRFRDSAMEERDEFGRRTESK